ARASLRSRAVGGELHSREAHGRRRTGLFRPRGDHRAYWRAGIPARSTLLSGHTGAVLARRSRARVRSLLAGFAPDGRCYGDPATQQERGLRVQHDRTVSGARQFLLHTARIGLRRIDVDDADEIFSLDTDPDVSRYTGDEPLPSLAAMRQAIAEYDDYERY